MVASRAAAEKKDSLDPDPVPDCFGKTPGGYRRFLIHSITSFADESAFDALASSYSSVGGSPTVADGYLVLTYSDVRVRRKLRNVSGTWQAFARCMNKWLNMSGDCGFRVIFNASAFSAFSTDCSLKKTDA